MAHLVHRITAYVVESWLLEGLALQHLRLHGVELLHGALQRHAERAVLRLLLAEDLHRLLLELKGPAERRPGWENKGTPRVISPL